MHSPSNAELLADYTLHLTAERGLSENTVVAYIADLWQYAEILEQRDSILFTADKDDVAAFIHHLAGHEIGARSRSRKISALRRFYRWLIQNERLEKDPTRLTSTPKLSKLLPRPVEAALMRQVLEGAGKRAAALDASPYEIRDYAILETFYGSGMRVSELCGIRQQDLALEAGKTYVRGKGDKERIVPLGDSAVMAIESYLHAARPHLAKSGKPKSKGTGALFISEQGTQITRQRVYQIVSGSFDVEHVSPHRLRHSCATDMLRNGADLRIVQEQLGHAKLDTTQIYTKVAQDHLQQAHARFHPRGRGK